MKIEGRRKIVGEPVQGMSLESLIVEAAAAARPPERLSVSEAAERHRQLNNPGSYVGPWKNSMTPYLVEPMDVLQSREFTGMVFAGPAQCGKTDMVLNWLTYSAVCDPADMMVVQTSNTTARDFSMRRIDRLHRHSPAIGSKLAGGKQGDNTFDKHYRNGMLLTMAWPAINELSGKPIPRLWLTDYDRMPADIDGEGSAFDLARKRATSFRSFGMCAAESSPGFIVENANKWVRKTSHEAPPTRGILALYNRGDRRRWQWACVKCHGRFEPSFELLHYPDTEDHMEAAESAVLRCPHCFQTYGHDPQDHMPGKYEMNENGMWVRDGMVWTEEGVFGTPIRSSIASFWLKGVAATFSDWKTLVFNFLNAEDEYQSSGSEESLKTTVNTDQGEPYTPKSAQTQRAPETLQARAFDFGHKVVPEPVRFLIATIDVQKNRFVVQVHGIAHNRDVYVIDRFEIKKSRRLDEDGERKWVNPGAFPEDWKILAEEVLMKSYPLSDGSGREMAIRFTVSDSGGKDGVTANAYDFVRWLRRGDVEEGDEPSTEELTNDEGEYKWSPELASRFMLLKGASTQNAPRISVSYPDSQRKDRMAGARGEIPVLMINTNMLKDIVDNKLDRKEPGGRVCFAHWLDANFYIELTVEIKDPKKGWLNPKRFRNESWDLLAYLVGATLHPAISLEHMNMMDPPSWAAEWDHNDLVFNPVTNAKPFEATKKPEDRMAALAKLAESLG